MLDYNIDSSLKVQSVDAIRLLLILIQNKKIQHKTTIFEFHFLFLEKHDFGNGILDGNNQKH